MSNSIQNALLATWSAPYGLPPFGQFTTADFPPAFAEAMAAHNAEIETIANQTAAPDFANTIAALDATGARYHAIGMLFGNLTSAETSPELQAIELELAPRLAAHDSAIYLNSALFARIDALYAKRASLALSPEQLRLLERVHLDFVQAGAKLDASVKPRYAAIVSELASLSTTFSQNVLADESTQQLLLTDEADLAGLPGFLRNAAKAAAEERGLKGYAITLSRSMMEPFLTFSARRDLREAAFKIWNVRGENSGVHDNRPIAATILKLRHEQAALHGYASFADYAMVDKMAGTQKAVFDLLNQVWEPAKRRAADEQAALEAYAAGDGFSGALEPWDWRYYAEKVRQSRYDLDDAEVKPYFELNAMIGAMFDCAEKLFGLRFVEQQGIAMYHPDVRVFEVKNAADELTAIFISDNFARPSKSGGAWMSAYRLQSKAHGTVIPVIANHNNFAKAPAGEATLLSLDDVRTLFHEFGHGLHGMLSNVTYERLSGTNVLQDYVELPSQLYEHWALEPGVLQKHARHYQTGEPIPASLQQRIAAAQLFNVGFETVQYTACALVDLALHGLSDYATIDIQRFETEELARLGMPRAVGMRHRLPHFGHLFSGSDYAAGYYVYMWAEVLDADAFDAFKEAGDPFDASTAQRLKQFVYSAGNSLEPREGYAAFRGRAAKVEPMLRDRGLLATA